LGSNNYTMHHIPFSENLLDFALKQVADNSIFVFPTRVSAEKAREKFLRNWSFEDCKFISIDDFKDYLILPSEPPLTDEKRLLCLYQALKPEDKEFFHFYTYFDLINWGNDFFQFFEELNDENINPEEIKNRVNLLQWQEEFLDKILVIRNNFKQLLNQKGLTDPIFYRLASQIKVPFSEHKVIWVNQYYYTQLELAILDALIASENEVVIISQTENPIFNPEDREITPLNLDKLTKEHYLTEKIEVIETENEDQMVISFLGKLTQIYPSDGTYALMDSHFWDKHYRNLMNPEFFEFSDTINLVNSGPYQFLNILLEHLKAKTTLSLSGKEIIALPIKKVIDAVGNESFVRYYFPHNLEENKKILWNELTFLCSKNIYWLDKNLKCAQNYYNAPDFKILSTLLNQHFDLLEEIGTIKSPSDLMKLIDDEENPHSLKIRKMCNEQELLSSNLLEQFYQRVANFASIDNLHLVSDWNHFFSESDRNLAINVFRLFLDFLENAGYKFYRDYPKNDNPIIITNLLDLRNLRYDNLIIFHAIEGEFPSTPKPVWLLNENQRKQLGLKTYNDLREWERYYFFRQILTSRNVLIYTYRSMDLDIEPGSFVTELQQLRQNVAITNSQFHYDKPKIPISELYKAFIKKYGSPEKSLINPYPDYLSLSEQNQLLDEQDFFIIPCEPQQDFGKELTLTCPYYNLQQLLENPFVWFIQCLQKLNEIDFRPQDKVSKMMVGSLVHRFISDLLSPLNGKRCSLEELESVLNQRESSLSTKFNDLLSSDDFLFLLPQNPSLQFIRDIYSSHLAQSIKSFYWDFLVPKIENNNFTLYVEKGKYEENSTKESPLPLEYESKENQVKVILRGRSDLRFEAANQKIIVDFKTGRNPNKNQLYFYEWLYYRYIQEDMDIFSTFWIISDNETKYKSSKDSALKWRNKVYTILANCIAEGYTLGRTLGELKQLKRITRADLYRPNKGGNYE